MRALVETEFRETFLEIRELKPQQRLVTSIEVLSPSNKRQDTPGSAQYLRKRQAHLAGQANLVEIDLLRGGPRMPMADDWPDSPYYLLVAARRSRPGARFGQLTFVSHSRKSRCRSRLPTLMCRLHPAPHRRRICPIALRYGHRLSRTPAAAAERRGSRVAEEAPGRPQIRLCYKEQAFCSPLPVLRERGWG